MSDSSFVKSSRTSESTTSYENPVLANVDRLRSKLKDFAVLDRNEQPVGRVRDLILDSSQHLNLVIAQPQTATDQRCVLLSSKLIHKVSTQNQTIFVDATQADISYLPEYSVATTEADINRFNVAGATVQHPVDQLPATAGVTPDTHLERAEPTLAAGLEHQSASTQGLFEYEPTPKAIDDSNIATPEITTPEISSDLSDEFSESGHFTSAAPASDSAINHPVIPSEPTTMPLPEPEPSLPNEPATDISSSSNLDTIEIDDLTTPSESKETTVKETTVREEIVIPLLEERLQVDYQHRKIGEVVVRKKIETRIVEVPVRYERLLIEQVSPEHKQLADIDLSNGEIAGVDLVGRSSPLVSGEFTSPKVASQVLDAIAKTLHHRCKKVRIELELDDAELSETYQNWIDQYRQQEAL